MSRALGRRVAESVVGPMTWIEHDPSGVDWVLLFNEQRQTGRIGVSARDPRRQRGDHGVARVDFFDQYR